MQTVDAKSYFNEEDYGTYRDYVVNLITERINNGQYESVYNSQENEFYFYFVSRKFTVQYNVSNDSVTITDKINNLSLSLYKKPNKIDDKDYSSVNAFDSSVKKLLTDYNPESFKEKDSTTFFDLLDELIGEYFYNSITDNGSYLEIKYIQGSSIIDTSSSKLIKSNNFENFCQTLYSFAKTNIGVLKDYCKIYYNTVTIPVCFSVRQIISLHGKRRALEYCNIVAPFESGKLSVTVCFYFSNGFYFKKDISVTSGNEIEKLLGVDATNSSTITVVINKIQENL